METIFKLITIEILRAGGKPALMSVLTALKASDGVADQT